ncbi:MAG: cation:proton antiporter [Deltaproteobacteria bacterium]|nr:cation:proton antiporter [Deltaproteobacteria bacterium]
MTTLPPIFGSLALLAVLGIAVTLILRRLSLPPVAGLLVAGALAGPHGLGLLRDQHHIEILAEVGVVLLLFTIGLEFSLTRLKVIAKSVVVGGSLQVGLTVAVVAAVALHLGFSTGQAVFFGFVFALSSTAIVLRALGERAALDAPHGRFIVGVLIFQDLAVVPMLLLVPLLAGPAEGDVALQIGLTLGKAVAVVIGTIVVARVLLPRAFAAVDAARSREVFALALLAVCLGTAWLTAAVGLSLALGAFIAGVVMADTDYAHQAMADVVPARDLLTSVFFMSMGMLFDPQAVVQAPGTVLALLLAFIVGKGLIAALAAMGMRFPARVAWLAGAALGQFGEFGFVLAQQAMLVGLVSRETMQPLLAAGLLSMFVTRIVVAVAPRFHAGQVILRPLEKLLRVRSIDDATPADQQLRNHVVVVGFGPGGQLVAKHLKERAVPYLVLDLNAETVRAERARGEHIYYGDVTSAEAQGHAHVKQAAAVALMISDPAAARRAVAALQAAAPDTAVFVRSRYTSEREELCQLGAEVVVSEEMAGSEALCRKLGDHLGKEP